MLFNKLSLFVAGFGTAIATTNLITLWEVMPIVIRITYSVLLLVIVLVDSRLAFSHRKQSN